MKYKLDSLRLPSIRPTSKFYIFWSFLIFETVNPLLSFGQDKTTWSITAELGTSLNKTHDDTLVQQGLLLPVFGVSVGMQRILSHGVNLQLALGYRNRGGLAKVDAVIDPVSGKSMGEYKISSRDHFVSNDIALRFKSRYWKLFDHIPYFTMGIRNDIYVLTNSRTLKDEIALEEKGMSWYRSRHFRPYVVGLVGGMGLQRNKWGFGLEYYHQVLGAYLIPSTVRSNYSQLFSQSLTLTANYSF